MKLKQKLAIGLCAFYIFSVIGIALSMHFCGGKLASVAVNSNKTACKFCKAEPVEKKDNGCCKNTKVELKVKDDHQVGKSFQFAKLFSVDLFLPTNFINQVKNYVPLFFTKLINKAPPKVPKVAVHIFNCIFRN
jgi:hypothetical protein